MHIYKSKCIALFLIAVVCFFGLLSCGETGNLNNTTVNSKNDVTGNGYEVFPSTYFNISDSTSLLKVKAMSYYGVFYSCITRAQDGIDFNSQKIIIFEAKVEEDYYGNLNAGDKIYIAFPLEFEWGLSPYRIDEKQFIQIISNCESLVFYTSTLNIPQYIYEDIECEEKKIEFDMEFENICFSYYYSDGIIPITDSTVDFNSLKTIDIDVEELYHNICLSGYSILQGDSVEKMRETIKELIKTQVYGG